MTLFALGVISSIGSATTLFSIIELSLYTFFYLSIIFIAAQKLQLRDVFDEMVLRLLAVTLFVFCIYCLSVYVCVTGIIDAVVAAGVHSW